MAAVLGFVYQSAQLHGQPAMPELGLMRRHLHGDRQEPLVVAPDVRLQKRLDLLSGGHGVFCTVAPLGSNPEDLHYFVAKAVDDLDGDAAGGGAVEGGEVSLCRVSQASRLISALRVVLSDL